MAACGPIPPQADPRVPGRNLTGSSFNIMAPSLPLLLYIYSKKIKRHNKKLFPRDLISETHTVSGKKKTVLMRPDSRLC